MNATCPPKSKLKSLSMGLLPDDESGELLRHLDGCETCQQDIQSADNEDDTLINQIKSGVTIEAKSGFESESECRIAGVKALAALGADGNSSNDSGFEFPKTIGDYEIVRPLGKGGICLLYTSPSPRD